MTAFFFSTPAELAEREDRRNLVGLVSLPDGRCFCVVRVGTKAAPPKSIASYAEMIDDEADRRAVLDSVTGPPVLDPRDEQLRLAPDALRQIVSREGHAPHGFAGEMAVIARRGLP